MPTWTIIWLKLNEYVDKSGLNICNILDQKIMDNPKVYNKYLAQLISMRFSTQDMEKKEMEESNFRIMASR